MLGLRRQGWTMYALAEKYDVERTSIRYHLIKNGLNGRVVRISVIRTYSKKPKRYEDYLEEAKRRHPDVYTGCYMGEISRAESFI